MEVRSVSVVGVWAFAIVWLVGSFVAGADLLFALVIFIVAIGVSAALSMLPKS